MPRKGTKVSSMVSFYRNSKQLALVPSSFNNLLSEVKEKKTENDQEYQLLETNESFEPAIM